MSMICFYCYEPVYTAETKTYDGKTFHHGVCFGIWKKELDRELANERNSEYYKIPDVSTTKIRVSNYNTVIYATQYDPEGTQPNATYAGSTNSSELMNSSDTVTSLPVFPVVARQRASSFSRRPASGTFVPRPSGTFIQTNAGTWTNSNTVPMTASDAIPRSSSVGTIGRARAGTASEMTSSGTITSPRSTITSPRSTATGSSGSWIDAKSASADTLKSTVSAPASSWLPTRTSSGGTLTRTTSGSTLIKSSASGSSGSWIPTKKSSGGSFLKFSPRGDGTIAS